VAFVVLTYLIENIHCEGIRQRALPGHGNARSDTAGVVVVQRIVVTERRNPDISIVSGTVFQAHAGRADRERVRRA
jgi:hypothetical protein